MLEIQIYENFGKYGTPKNEYTLGNYVLVGPTQSSISIVLNKNGKIGWWNLDKSLKSPHLKT